MKKNLLLKAYSGFTGKLALIVVSFLFLEMTRAQITQTFSYTGSAQSFVVPAGVSSVSIKIWGAGGAGSDGSGGSGAFLKGTLAVTSGQTLTIIVGGGGSFSASAVSTGGYGGGGASGGAYGGSGGGYSGIFSSATLSQANVLALAGGGGGGGYYGDSSYGGAGGATAGSNGGNAASTSYTSGRGATIAAAGTGGQYNGTDNRNGYTGAALQGAAGNSFSATYSYYGGGGGGGYYGGGSGYSSGSGANFSSAGGGGSSYISGSLTATTNTVGVTSNAGAATQAPGNAETGYVSGIGNGGAGSISATAGKGGNGLITITYNTIACTTPTAQPTALTFGTISATSIAGSFTAPGTAPSGYLILRSTSSTAPTPVNGTSYATGNTVTLGGNSYYVIQGSATTANAITFTDSALTSNTRYYYYIYSYNNACTGAPYYLTTSPLSDNKITCAAAPASLSVGTITSTGATFTWTSAVGGSAGAISSTLNIYSNSGYTTLVASVPGVTSSYVLSSGLNSNTTYYYQIVNTNAGGCSSSTNGGSFTTLCGSVGIPYLEDFNSVTTPAIPSCTTVINAGSGSSWATAANPAANGFSSQVLRYAWNTSNAANTWFFTKGLNLTSGVSYRLTFKYNNNSSTFVEKMKVAYGTNNTVAAMTNTLADYPNIAGGASTANSVTIDFVPSSTGVFYIGFQAYSAADQFYLYLDDIAVNVSPDPIVVTPAAPSFCAGGSTALTASSATAYTYSWSPGTGLSSTSGATVTASPTTTTTYAVTGTSGSITNTKTVTVTVNPVPTNVTVTETPSAAIACDMDYVKLEASGGIGNAVAYSENFSAGVSSNWAYAGTNTNIIGVYYNSNNAGGAAYEAGLSWSAGSNTTGSWVFLPYNVSTSQDIPIDISAFTSLNLSFKYMFDADTSTSYVRGIYVDVSTDNNSWTNVWSRTAITADIAATQISNVSLASYIGNSQLYIRFRYTGESYGLFDWYIDDIVFDGNKKLVTWSPSTGLYTDAGLATPYNGTDYLSTVYAAPGTATVYTAKATLGTCDKTAVTSSIIRSKMQYTGVGTDWSTGSNWFPAVVPDVTKCANIPAGKTVEINATAQAKTITIANTAKLTIKANNSLRIVDNINVTNNSNNDNLTLESDAVLLQDNASATNTGKILARRDVKMRKMDYTYWSSPVTGQKLLNDTTLNDGFSVGTPNNRIFYYNEPNDTFKAVPATETTFINSKGYAIRGKDSYNASTLTSDNTLKFVGIPNNGSYTINIQKSANTGTGGAVEHGYNLIGNPYPSNIDFVKFYNLGNNKNIIYGKAWFWTDVTPVTTQQGSTYSGNNYATITLAGGTPPTYSDTTVTPSPTSGAYTPTKNIKLGQGFIVQAKNLGTGQTINFDNTIRTNESGVFFNNKTSEQTNRYWLKLISPENVINTILIAHLDEATNNYEGDYDADILVVGDDSFYSKVDSHKLQIQARSTFADNDIVEVGTKYSVSGNYKISLENSQGIFSENQNIYLKDKLLNVITNLREKDYSFTASKGVDETRFEVIYKDNAVLASDSSAKSEFEVYRSNDNFIIKSSKPLNQINVYDTSGRLLISAKTVEKTFMLDSSQLINGVYIIKADNSGDVKTKKIIK